MRMVANEFDGLFSSLAIAAQSYKEAVNDELSHHGITMRQWRVIKCLCSEDNIAIGRLAERLRLRSPTLVGVLSRMSRNGLVTLVALRSDRRVKRVRLSSRGRGLCAVGAACEQRVEVEVLSGLSDVDVSQLISVLQKICRNLQS